MKKKPLRQIKWPKAGLENLLGRSCIKRRIRRIAIRDYQMGEYQKPSHSFNDVTCESSTWSWFMSRRFPIEIIKSGKYTKIKSNEDILTYVEYQESWASHWVKNTSN